MKRQFDAVIVGGGFGGLHMLWKLRQMGRTAIAIEKGGDVGGTWYWNRYPGARCDVPSIEYSIPWDAELDQEWDWGEKYSAQPEILAYIRHIAERHDLKRDMIFDTTVTAMNRDEARKVWTVETDTNGRFEAPIVITAAGCLSTPNLPDIEGIQDFARPLYHTGLWPHEDVSMAGKRVGVIGTGSTGVQASTAIAKDAGHLFVFQRTAQFSLPALNRPLSEEEKQNARGNYPQIRENQRDSFAAQYIDPPAGMKAFDDPKERRFEVYEKCWNAGRQDLMGCYGDIQTDEEVNEEVGEFVRGKIRQIINDPALAEKLVPKINRFGTRRIIMDTGYFEIFNQENVSLIDIREDPIERVTATGVMLKGGTFVELDMLVIATGYDAVTGPLLAMNITGCNSQTLNDKWATGPETYLGIMVEGFPNLFTITGPLSPTVHANVVYAIDQHVEWIADCLEYMNANEVEEIEPTREAEKEWQGHVSDVGSRTLRAKDVNNWYLGQNVPGKPVTFLTYSGGLNNYRYICNNVASDGYRGFVTRRY